LTTRVTLSEKDIRWYFLSTSSLFFKVLPKVRVRDVDGGRGDLGLVGGEVVADEVEEEKDDEATRDVLTLCLSSFNSATMSGTNGEESPLVDT